MLFVSDTLTGKKVKFEPLQEGKVKIYVCGPTVYDNAHIGHARSAVVFDVVVRWLKYLGYDVTYVRNYTDIDDKIIKRSREEKIPWHEVAEKYIKSYEEDMRALNVKEPSFKPRVSRHIDDIIRVIQGLIDRGHAYVADGDVYFSVKSFKDYGKLSKRDTQQLLAGARVEPGEGKRDPLDFALWKRAKEGEPSWDSPWGKGRPGWHIECSVMSMKYLGETLDIHGGGLDLIFPHHENEIAQSESFTGKTFTRYWLHNGFVTIKGEKMSKSLGNFYTVKDILKEFKPPVLRLFLLSTHYRSPIDFSFDALKEVESALSRVKNFLKSAEALKSLPRGQIGEEPLDVNAFKAAFEDAMNDDFNTARALGVVFELIRAANTLKKSAIEQNRISDEVLESLESALSFVNWAFSEILGIELSDERGEGKEEKLIELLIDVRNRLRKEKNFELADYIRDRLKELGVTLEDLPSGTVYRRG